MRDCKGDQRGQRNMFTALRKKGLRSTAERVTE